MNVAIIPARGGSKGLPGKNIKLFVGKPLIAWSILQAKKCKHIDSVWVTSDSDEILDVACKFGAEAIKRPDELSSDTASSESAWIHAIDAIQNQKGAFQYVLGMQATSPLRQPQDLDQAFATFLQNQYNTLFSSVEIEDFFIWQPTADGSMTGVNHDFENRKRRQNIEKRYLENGSFYIFTPEQIKTKNNRLGGKIGTFPMDMHKRFQIDSHEDFVLCEAIMTSYKLDQI